MMGVMLDCAESRITKISVQYYHEVDLVRTELEYSKRSQNESKIITWSRYLVIICH